MIRPSNCPFCGGKNFIPANSNGKVSVMCLNIRCEAIGPMRKNWVTAVRIWNLRAEFAWWSENGKCVTKMVRVRAS